MSQKVSLTVMLRQLFVDDAGPYEPQFEYEGEVSQPLPAESLSDLFPAQRGVRSVREFATEASYETVARLIS